MRPECQKAVEEAIGRDLKEGEAKRIHDRLTTNTRELARRDRDAFASMSLQERLTAAAKLSLEQDMIKATNAASRKALNVVSQTRELAAQNARGKEIGGKTGNSKALIERIQQLDNYVHGVRNEIFGDFVDVMKAADPKFFGLIENKEARDKFVREVYGEDTGDADMKNAAKKYLEVFEKIRQRENAAGADIGKLDYSYLPQPHAKGKIAQVGKDRWVADTMPLMMRDRFVKEDGELMNDVELKEALEYAYDTLATDGSVRREAGKTVMGSRASRYDEAHRVLHFKDADSYLKYMDTYGEGSVFHSLQAHVNAHAKNIGLMEAWGANPTATYRLLKDTAEIEDSKIAGKPVRGVKKFGTTSDMLWDTLNGTTALPVNEALASGAQSVRNYITAVKLQGVMLSSLNDAATWIVAAKHNGLPLGSAFRQAFKSLATNQVEDAARLGLAVEGMTGEMAAWHADNFRQNWSSNLAQATMKLGLVESWTNKLRAGFGLMLSDQLATMRKTGWGALKDLDRARLERSGVTAKDWEIWGKAETQEVRGRDLLTKNTVRNVEGYSKQDINHATAALLGFLDSEGKAAVLAPDLITKAAMQQGTKSGTWGGEFLRSLMLFKSFPLAMVFRHLDRIRMIPSATGKFGYSMGLMTGLTLLGALSIELKDLVQGRNPRDAATGKFWGAAFAQGGGVGIFGDVLYTGMGGNSRTGAPNWANLAGPVIGTGIDALNLSLGNLGKVVRGDDTKFGAESLRFGRSNLPFLNLWYLKSAVDHAGFNDLQETVSPGYLARQRAAAAKDWGATWYWDPQEPLPTSAPSLASVTGNE